jgi:hypothetical protein
MICNHCPVAADTSIKKRTRSSLVEKDNASRTVEARQLRRSKAEVLGLRLNSALPKFSHKMSVKEIREYPQLDNWHMYRQAMENKIMEQHELPPHFQSKKANFLLHSDKTRKIETQSEKEKEKRKSRSSREVIRFRKLASRTEAQLAVLLCRLESSQEREKKGISYILPGDCESSAHGSQPMPEHRWTNAVKCELHEP